MKLEVNKKQLSLLKNEVRFDEILFKADWNGWSFFLADRESEPERVMMVMYNSKINNISSQYHQ